jgi:nitric oxide reductase subunit B
MAGAEDTSSLSPWWRHSAILVMIAGFAVLSYLTVRTYTDAPPIPDRVEDSSGRTLFTADDILRGQEVFLKYGLMEHGTLWGHGAYLGPDYSADTVHEAVAVGRDTLARGRYGRPYAALEVGPAAEVADAVRRTLKENRYDPATGTLRFTEIEAAALAESRRHWGDYFSGSTAAAGLPQKYIRERTELDDLATYFTWAAWAAVANRPGKDYSYTNNWPYDPAAGNTPSGPTYMWSALSLITLLAGIGTILFLFGRFDYLGWHQASTAGHSHDNLLLAWTWTPSQRATAWYLAVVAVLFLAQTLLGGVIAHYRVEPGAFYGFDLSRVLPYTLARTWHLQLAIFWVATAWVAGGLLLAPLVGGTEPPGQRAGVVVLLVALALVVFGSLFGEYQGVNGALGRHGSGWATRGPSTWTWVGSGRSCSPLASGSGSSCCIGHCGRSCERATGRNWAPCSCMPPRRSRSSICRRSSSARARTSP